MRIPKRAQDLRRPRKDFEIVAKTRVRIRANGFEEKISMPRLAWMERNSDDEKDSAPRSRSSGRIYGSRSHSRDGE